MLNHILTCFLLQQHLGIHKNVCRTIVTVLDLSWASSFAPSPLPPSSPPPPAPSGSHWGAEEKGRRSWSGGWGAEKGSWRSWSRGWGAEKRSWIGIAGASSIWISPSSPPPPSSSPPPPPPPPAPSGSHHHLLHRHHHHRLGSRGKELEELE
jgi:hypothetical protein